MMHTGNLSDAAVTRTLMQNKEGRQTLDRWPLSEFWETHFQKDADQKATGSQCLFSDEPVNGCGVDPWAGTRQTQPEEAQVMILQLLLTCRKQLRTVAMLLLELYSWSLMRWLFSLVCCQCVLTIHLSHKSKEQLRTHITCCYYVIIY